MLLYYAMGGGLGHLVRARAVLHTLGVERQAALLTASRHGRDRRVVGELPVHAPPGPLGADPAAVGDWVAGEIARLAPEELIVDVFPAGLLGELGRLPPRAGGPRLSYVARLLQWPAYAPLARGLSLRFARALVVEPLHPDHAAFIEGAADRVEPLALVDPPTMSTPSLPALPERFWLVVHAGTNGEIGELVAYARDLQRREAGAGADPEPIVICCPGGAPAPQPDGTTSVDLHPATPLYAPATRIVTACGFNVMRQLAPLRHKHHFLPLPRRYDDQFTRAAHARAQAGSTTRG